MRYFLAILILAPVAVHAEEWGDLSLQFIYDGEPPVVKPFIADKDEAVCGKKPFPNERLIVDKDTGGIANVLVWLANKSDEKVAMHPSYDEWATKPETLMVRNCRFEPHVLLVRTSQEFFKYKVADSIGHNAKVDFFANLPSSALVPGNAEAPIGITFPETAPVSFECSIHPWMRAWILVRDNPYMAASDAEGRIQIKNLPVGEWNFRIWHEQTGLIKNARRGDAEVKWSKGMANLRIKPGENNFGEFRLSPQLFKLK